MITERAWPLPVLAGARSPKVDHFGAGWQSINLGLFITDNEPT